MRAGLLAFALFACGSSDGEKEALQLANDLATNGVVKIEAAITAGRPVEGIFECVVNATNETLTKAGGAHAELAIKLGRLCDHDVPLAAIAKSVDEIEAARAKKPADTMLTECMVNDVSFALRALKNRDEAKPLLARYAIACPGEKLDY